MVMHPPTRLSRGFCPDALKKTETKHFIYFYIGSLAILIWKS